MVNELRAIVLPANQRRTLEELTEDLDLRQGDVRAKQSAFWTMLTLAGVIATAGVLADSTATVIGAMIIAPLSTPIMGIALGIVKRERVRAGRFVALGAVVVVLIGVLATLLIPGDIDLQGNSQITGRTSPTILDLVAAIATGIAGAVGLSRRDVAAVLPGVAIAISLVPPLAVVGVCLGEGEITMAMGALLLFLSNLVALVLAGTVIFAALGYAGESARDDAAHADADADQAFPDLAGADREPATEDAGFVARRVGPRRGTRLTIGVLLVAVMLPLAANTAFVLVLHLWTERVQAIATEWVADVPGAEVTGVDFESGTFRIDVRTTDDLPPTDTLLEALDGVVRGEFPVVIDTTYGSVIEVGTPASR
jgi:uncharacterized hydrophobic protein (TIGR00271 family)